MALALLHATGRAHVDVARDDRKQLVRPEPALCNTRRPFDHDMPVIAIAHRLSTIVSLDRVVVLGEGRMAERGRSEELLELDGLYARLGSRQTDRHIGND